MKFITGAAILAIAAGTTHAHAQTAPADAATAEVSGARRTRHAAAARSS